MLQDNQFSNQEFVRKAKKAIRKGFELQKERKGTCFIEVVSNCPSNWKMTPIDSNHWLEENMLPFYPFGDIKTPNGREIIMNEEIVIAGFGGQGVLSMGMVLCYSGMIENKEVSWMPSYGPEMRGGTANCIVIISDSKISSPIISKFDTVIALNQPSVDKFENAVKPGGLLIYESTNVINPPTRKILKLLELMRQC